MSPPPLFPPASEAILGLVLAALSLIVAAGGGIGGGVLLVPINLFLMKLGTRAAVAVSNWTIFGGALANLYFNLWKRHPEKPAPLIDWDVILVMEPVTILVRPPRRPGPTADRNGPDTPATQGAKAGALLNRMLPDWLTLLCMTVLLGFIAHKTMRRGLRTWKEESMQHGLDRRRRSALGWARFRSARWVFGAHPVLM